MREFIVKFKPQGISIAVPQGTDILSAAAKAGIVVSAPCGGEGICGKCRAKIGKGTVKAGSSRLLSEADRKKGVVLACQTLVESDLEVAFAKEALEPRERLSHEAEDFTKGVILEREKKFRLSPLISKVYLELAAPTADDGTSDLDRITDALKGRTGPAHISTKLTNIKHLSEVLRESDFKITAVLAYKDGALEILSFEPGDTTGSNLAFAFDIGTTTVAGQLIDLGTGSILGTRIAFNAQAAYGSDVITRMLYASDPGGMEKLNSAVVGNINEIIDDLVIANKADRSGIYAVVCAGNMTMMHLLLKIDPSGLRKAPYVPTVSAFPAVHAAELGIEISPRGIAAFLPGVGTYIGGDIVSGVLACGCAENVDLTLLVDIGTNGEIVLGNNEWMIGSAASAGPAFEGSGLACGMKAVSGAMQRITIDDGLDVKYETISGAPPKGICGSGYIDLLCQMLKRGVITKDGRINRGKASTRIRKAENNYEFVLAFARSAGIERDIVITDDDIDNLKRSKGAIYSAIISILNKVGKDISDVKKIYIAGGFGNYLNIENSIFIGLLPDIDRRIYEFVGNSSLAGARMSLLSHYALDATEAIHAGITYLDLAAEPGYMDEYIAALFFPHTEIRRFPSVRL
ncbi:MAG: ASKHA domain-containing protein [Candidatus Omnitrophota bacterium]